MYSKTFSSKFVPSYSRSPLKFLCMAIVLQNERKEVLLGPMKLYQTQMQVGIVVRFRGKNIQSWL